jgi:hypothetical protein
MLAFWALVLGCMSGMFFACAYALDAVPDNVLSLLLRVGVLFFGLLMIPLTLATVLWFSGLKGRQAVLVALLTGASSALAGYAHWRDVPMPWDDVVVAPEYVETLSWETLYAWQANPLEVPWNVLEPAFPRIERVWTRPQGTATRADVRRADFQWHSLYFLRASGFRIFGRFDIDQAGDLNNVYGFLRLPAAPYLDVERSTENTFIHLDFQDAANLADYSLTARLEGSGENISSEQVVTRADGATLHFPADTALPSESMLIVTLRDPANERTLLFRFLNLDAL